MIRRQLRGRASRQRDSAARRFDRSAGASRSHGPLSILMHLPMHTPEMDSSVGEDESSQMRSQPSLSPSCAEAAGMALGSAGAASAWSAAAMHVHPSRLALWS